MPVAMPTVWEFALVSADGKPCDLDETGRLRITDDGKSPVKVEIKPCEGKDWIPPRTEDLDLFEKALLAGRGGAFQRGELQSIRRRALERSRIPHTVREWAMAYEALALAADHLDAMEARVTIPGPATP